MAVLKNVGSSWHRGKQNSVMEWSQVKQGENGGGEQNADIEVNLPGCWVVVLSRMEGDPLVKVVQSDVLQKPQPVDEEGADKVDPSPSQVHCQAFACRKQVVNTNWIYNKLAKLGICVKDTFDKLKSESCQSYLSENI